MTIKYYTKTGDKSFGKDRKYVVGDAARFVGTLTGKSSIDQDDIDALISLGHTVREVKNIYEI